MMWHDSEEWSQFEKDIYMADVGYGVMVQWEYSEATTHSCSFFPLVGWRDGSEGWQYSVKSMTSRNTPPRSGPYVNPR